MKIEYVDAGELDVKATDARGVQRLWRIPKSQQPVIDGAPHKQIRIHRTLDDMESSSKWVATCAHTGLLLSGYGCHFKSRDKAVEAALEQLEKAATVMETLIGEHSIPDDEPVYIVWYPNARLWLRPQYDIVHGETSGQACTRYGKTLTHKADQMGVEENG